MNEYELDIQVTIRQVGGYGSGALSVSERATVPAKGFLELCQVLAQFHELAERLKAANVISAH